MAVPASYSLKTHHAPCAERCALQTINLDAPGPRYNAPPVASCRDPPSLSLSSSSSQPNKNNVNLPIQHAKTKAYCSALEVVPCREEFPKVGAARSCKAQSGANTRQTLQVKSTCIHDPLEDSKCTPLILLLANTSCLCSALR